MGLIQRLPELSPEDFRRHWLGPHGTAAAKMPGLRQYYQNHVVDRAQLGIAYPRGPWDLDGFSELWFDDSASMRRAIASPAYTGVATDTPRLMTMPGLIVAEQNVVTPKRRTPEPLLKRMSILTRRADVDPQRFKQEWTQVHAGLVAQLPDIAGYTQNLVFAREIRPNEDCPYEALPIDGIVELWFPNLEAVETSFASAAGCEVMKHARSFIAEITTFLVETHVIVDGG